jgi:ornithine cyclodeaminase/alanine dehydrogenase-like protein (mu-crystallin family)
MGGSISCVGNGQMCLRFGDVAFGETTSSRGESVYESWLGRGTMICAGGLDCGDVAPVDEDIMMVFLQGSQIPEV